MKHKARQEKIYALFIELIHKDNKFKDIDLKREALALSVGTNRTYLEEAVKECSGKTITQAVNDYRLLWTAEVLSKNKEASIRSIWEEAGFRSRSNFNKLFYDRYGMTPTEWRNSFVDNRERHNFDYTNLSNL